MRAARFLCAALVAMTVAAAGSFQPASADTSDTGSQELAFVAKLNELRASKGLAPLADKGELFDMARTWAGHMEEAKGISHNPQLAALGPAGWTRLGENVGMGYDVQSLHDAFVNSPLHYRNMVDPLFDSVGVGVVHAPDGEIFVTVNFETTGAQAAPAPAKLVSTRSAPRTRRVCSKNSRGRRVCRTVRA